MSSTDLLSRLRGLDVQLWLEKDRLRYRAPDGAMTPALRAELTEHKPEIVTFLRQAQDDARATLPPIRPVSRDGTLSLSFAQRRLWFLDQFEPNSPAYNIFVAWCLSGWLDVAALERSIDQIVRRHEALRTNFVTRAGQPVQVISPEPEIPLPLVDLRPLAEAERMARLEQLAQREAQQPFDLAHDPLLRARLVRLDESEHVLLLTMHHIVSDGWSLGVFVHELAQLYQAFSTGQPSPLPHLPIQYADFAAWQRDWLQGEVLETQLDYWKRRLGEGAPVLELPTDRPRPAAQSFRGARQSFRLPLTRALKAFSQREGVTLFMTLLAAFKVLLYRYTGQTDIAVGSPIANRQRAELEGLIGFFVNTLVLQTGVTGELRFRELLAQVREITLGAYAHQDLPFEKLVEELQPERSLSHSPLFQVMFVLHNLPEVTLELSDLCLSQLEIESGTAQFDLTLSMFETESELLGVLEYNTDLFEAATIERLVGHFRILLEGIIAQPDQPIAHLPLLTPTERQQLLVTWNDTRADYARDRCVHQLIEAQVERNPRGIALTFGEQSLTYRELNHRANQLGRYLRQLGVGPGSLVGVCLERSLEMVVGVLGVLKAGGAYVPLDPNYPPQRLSYVVQDTGLSVLLTHASQFELSQRLQTKASQSDQSIRLVSLDDDWATIAQQSQENLKGGATSQHLAYVTYTSGSTGTPKGVQIPHAAVVNFLNAMRKRPRLTAQDTLLAVTTLSFDISGLELFLPLLVAAGLVLVDREASSDGEGLMNLLETSGATVMQATPASWQLLIGAGWQGNEHFKIMCGGEALPRDLANQLLDRCGSLWNMYGPTETTIWSGAWPIQGKEGPVFIGGPIDNTQLYVLDRHLNPVPIGTPGELYIGGDGLSWGYLNRPGLTVERFVPNPFSSEAGARMYKTGDLVRYRPGGEIEFLGRLDHQVKIRGFRIELGEIEAALGQHPALEQVVVVAQEGERGVKQLVAYYVTKQKKAPTTSELQAFVKRRLPEYMVPAIFVQLEAMPLTPNEKIDRKALPIPDGSRPKLEQSYVAPRTHEEEVLAEIWAELLGLDRVGVHDNFFELGGHSLLATQLVSRLRDALNLELPLRYLFESPTVAGLTERVEALRWAAQPPPTAGEDGYQEGDL